jgi:L-lactate utilization protein LutB
VPAIHRNRAGIRDIFQREMPVVDPALTDDPAVLAGAARRHLRRKFLSARVRSAALRPLPGCMNVCPVYEHTATRTAGLPRLVSAGAGPSGPRRLAGRALRRRGRDPGW